MKLKMHDWDMKPVKFYCEGREIYGVVEADDVEGYLEVIDTNENGKSLFDENNKVITRRIYGTILIQKEE